MYDKEFTVSHATVPRQRNGFDCGVHTIMTAKSVIELKKVKINIIVIVILMVNKFHKRTSWYFIINARFKTTQRLIILYR